MNVPAGLYYTKTHEWARRQERETIVGITSHAQEELRDVVFIELPAVGASLTQGKPAAVIESVKAAFDIYAPVSGAVTRVNAELAKNPQLVNEDCYNKGWLFAIAHSSTDEFSNLLSCQDYAKQISAKAR